jgi:hypothetical protein
MRRIHICVAVALMVVSAMAMSFCFAQTKQPAASPQVEYYQLTELKVNPGMSADFESFLKADLMPLLKKTNTFFGTLRPSGYGNPDLYLMLSPANLASLDGPDIFSGLSQDARKAIMAKFNRLIAGGHFSVLQGKPKMSISPQSGYALKVAMCIRTIVAPGRTDEYEKSIAELVGLIGKANAAKGVLTSRFGMGGNTNEYMMTVLTDSFSELGMFYLNIGKATAGVKLYPETGIVMHQEVTTYRYAPELSFEAAP